jgi:hypothetical protein
MADIIQFPRDRCSPSRQGIATRFLITHPEHVYYTGITLAHYGLSGECQMSVADLVEETGLKKPKVQSALYVLRELGFVAVVSEPVGPQPTVYSVNWSGLEEWYRQNEHKPSGAASNR